MSYMKRFLEQVAESMGMSVISARVLKEAGRIIKNGEVNRCGECGLFLGGHTETCSNNEGET